MIIILKNSKTPSSIPKPGNLEYGEPAINYSPGSEGLYIKNSNNEVIKLGGPDSYQIIEDDEEVIGEVLNRLYPRIQHLEKGLQDAKNRLDAIEELLNGEDTT